MFQRPGPSFSREGQKETIFTTLLSIHHFDICSSGTWHPLVLNISFRPNLERSLSRTKDTGKRNGELYVWCAFTLRFLCVEKCKWGVDADHTAALLCARPEESLSHTWPGFIFNFLWDPCITTETFQQLVSSGHKCQICFFLYTILRSLLSVQDPHRQTKVEQSQMHNICENCDKAQILIFFFLFNWNPSEKFLKLE